MARNSVPYFPLRKFLYGSDRASLLNELPRSRPSPKFRNQIIVSGATIDLRFGARSVISCHRSFVGAALVDHPRLRTGTRLATLKERADGFHNAPQEGPNDAQPQSPPRAVWPGRRAGPVGHRSMGGYDPQVVAQAGRDREVRARAHAQPEGQLARAGA